MRVSFKAPRRSPRSPKGMQPRTNSKGLTVAPVCPFRDAGPAIGSSTRPAESAPLPAPACRGGDSVCTIEAIPRSSSPQSKPLVQREVAPAPASGKSSSLKSSGTLNVGCPSMVVACCEPGQAALGLRAPGSWSKGSCVAPWTAVRRCRRRLSAGPCHHCRHRVMRGLAGSTTAHQLHHDCCCGTPRSEPPRSEHPAANPRSERSGEGVGMQVSSHPGDCSPVTWHPQQAAPPGDTHAHASMWHPARDRRGRLQASPPPLSPPPAPPPPGACRRGPPPPPQPRGSRCIACHGRLPCQLPVLCLHGAPCA
jgi:hypothetical protein